jgi:hypothetical protein
MLRQVELLGNLADGAEGVRALVHWLSASKRFDSCAI